MLHILVFFLIVFFDIYLLKKKKKLLNIEYNNHEIKKEEKIFKINSGFDWEDFIGGGYAKKLLQRKVELYKKENIMPEHFILSAKGGMGKTTLVEIFASKMGIDFIEVPADQLKKNDDFFELIGKIKDDTILFFEECQCLDKDILVNHIYRLMEKNTIIKNNETIKLPRICIIGATTDIDKFQEMNSFISRFKAKIEIEDYSNFEMGKIIENRAIIDISDSDKKQFGIEIAKRSFGIPRIALGHLKSIEEIAMVENKKLSVSLVNKYFEEIGLDKNGLSKKHLRVIEFFKSNENKPMSIKRLSIAMGFNRTKVFESEIELPMSMMGLIDSTSRGRCLSAIGLKYLD